MAKKTIVPRIISKSFIESSSADHGSIGHLWVAGLQLALRHCKPALMGSVLFNLGLFDHPMNRSPDFLSFVDLD
jgi:hypothetical protein